MTYEMQSWSRVLSPVPLEKGPPYPPGMFFTFNRPASLAECVAGFERLADPTWGGTTFKPEEHRIVVRDPKKRVIMIADCYGEKIGSAHELNDRTAVPMRERRKPVPVAA